MADRYPTKPAASGRRDTLSRLRRHPRQALAILLIVLLCAAAFAYVGGGLAPHRLSSARFVDALEANAGGPHRGFRRAHAKGMCVEGSFTATPQARRFSKAAVFSGATVPVTGRLAEASPDPYLPDSHQKVRSMALRLTPSHGGEWRTGMNDTPGMAVSTPAAFFQLGRLSRPDHRTGKPDAAGLKAFLAEHPETVAYNARAAAKPLSSSFANDTYNGINGFYFVDRDGARRLVRWRMQPQTPFSTLSPAVVARQPPNYLFDDLLARLAAGPLKWRLIATFAGPGDPNRAAELWPAERPQVVMGELTLRRAEAEAPGNCRDLNFDPMVLPPGIQASEDPIPWARSAVYSMSFQRRMSEAKPPSAVHGRSYGEAE
jgi:catalase